MTARTTGLPGWTPLSRRMVSILALLFTPWLALALIMHSPHYAWLWTSLTTFGQGIWAWILISRTRSSSRRSSPLKKVEAGLRWLGLTVVIAVCLIWSVGSLMFITLHPDLYVAVLVFLWAGHVIVVWLALWKGGAWAHVQQFLWGVSVKSGRHIPFDDEATKKVFSDFPAREVITRVIFSAPDSNKIIKTTGILYKNPSEETGSLWVRKDDLNLYNRNSDLNELISSSLGNQVKKVFVELKFLDYHTPYDVRNVHLTITHSTPFLKVVNYSLSLKDSVLCVKGGNGEPETTK